MIHSVELRNENPMNIPKVPPTFPKSDIHERTKYSFFIVLSGWLDLITFVAMGSLNCTFNLEPLTPVLNPLKPFWFQYSISALNSFADKPPYSVLPDLT